MSGVVNDGRSVRWGSCLVGVRPSERWRLRLDRGEGQTVTTLRDEAVDSEYKCESTRCYSPFTVQYSVPVFTAVGT